MSASRRLAAIMFTDLAGFTPATQADEPGALRALEEQERLLRPIVELHRGRRVKSMGDGQLIEFPNALDAVECAVDLQQHARSRNARAQAAPLHLRIGIHLGDVEDRGEDILGDAVNIAARVEPRADPGGVCISESVLVQIQNKVPYRFEPLGRSSLKGVRDPVNLYRVVLPWDPTTAPAATLGAPRLAILPLSNISPDPNDEYLADGLTEELITVLSQIKGLRVISRTSVGQYKGTTKSVGQISSELGADSVLEGSVRKVGDQLRIAVQLIDAKTDEHRWAQTYEKKLENVFAIQAEVAERTASALKVELLSSERKAIQGRPTADLEAYEAYLRGIQASQQYVVRFEASVDAKASNYFEDAIRQDPQFSTAKARYASHLIQVMGETRPRSELVPKIRTLLSEAIAMNPDSSEGHSALGSLYVQVDHDWGRAEAEYRRAIELNPSNAEARLGYEWLLRVLQRFPEAREQLTRALEQDPLSYLARFSVVDVFYSEGDLVSGVPAAEKLVIDFPENPAPRSFLAQFYAWSGRRGDARRTLEPLAGNTDWISRAGRAHVLALLDEPGQARALLSDWEAGRTPLRYSPARAALLYASLGEFDRALDALERDDLQGEGVLWILYQNYAFDALRQDARFGRLLRAQNLPITLRRTLFSRPGGGAR